MLKHFNQSNQSCEQEKGMAIKWLTSGGPLEELLNWNNEQLREDGGDGLLP